MSGVCCADNVEYGFDPHDDSDYLHIVGNDVWGNGERAQHATPAVRLDRNIISESCWIGHNECASPQGYAWLWNVPRRTKYMLERPMRFFAEGMSLHLSLPLHDVRPNPAPGLVTYGVRRLK